MKKKKFVPYDKMSKKEKRKINSQARNDWGDLDPTTKVVPDKRKEKKYRDDYYYDEEE